MPPLITLIPNSGIHFWDVDLDADALPRQARMFWEEPLGGPPDEHGAIRARLHRKLWRQWRVRLVIAQIADAR